jgi:hypothetical protein
VVIPASLASTLSSREDKKVGILSDLIKPAEAEDVFGT